MEAEHHKKVEYYNTLTEHIEKRKEMKMNAVGMNKHERNFNSKVLAKMSNEPM